LDEHGHAFRKNYEAPVKLNHSKEPQSTNTLAWVQLSEHGKGMAKTAGRRDEQTEMDLKINSTGGGIDTISRKALFMNHDVTDLT
jgi:hypothetical protein